MAQVARRDTERRPDLSAKGTMLGERRWKENKGRRDFVSADKSSSREGGEIKYRKPKTETKNKKKKTRTTKERGFAHGREAEC